MTSTTEAELRVAKEGQYISRLLQELTVQLDQHREIQCDNSEEIASFKQNFGPQIYHTQSLAATGGDEEPNQRGIHQVQRHDCRRTHRGVIFETKWDEFPILPSILRGNNHRDPI